MNLRIDELDLSYPVKHIASVMMKNGGVCKELLGTKLYRIMYHRNEYILSKDMNPVMPYMYGVIFSSLYFWRQILEYLRIPFVYIKPPRVHTVSVFVTNDGYYNAIQWLSVTVTGDGKSTVKNLIAKENMKRINNPSKLVFPIKNSYRKPALDRVLEKGKTLHIPHAVDYADITSDIHQTYIDVCRKVLTALPRLPYLGMTVYAKDVRQKKKCFIGKPDLTGGINVFFPATNGKKQMNAGEKIVTFLR
jgi:hypothetical protein